MGIQLTSTAKYVWADADHRLIAYVVGGTATWTDTAGNTGTISSGSYRELAAPHRFSSTSNAALELIEADEFAQELPANVKDHGAQGDGVTDDTAAFTAALGVSTYVFVPPGDYVVNGLSRSAPFTIIGAGRGRTTLRRTTGAIQLRCRGTAGSTVNVTADVAVRSTTLTVASTTGISAGDYLILRSNALWPTTFQGYNKGEVVRVWSVDSATQLNLFYPTRDSYITADSATIQEPTYLDSPRVEGITFTSARTSTFNAFVVTQFEYCKNVQVVDCEFQNSPAAGVSLVSCLDWIVDRCTFVDFQDQVDSLDAFGYGVFAGAACQGGAFSNSKMRRGRHMFTTGGVGGFLDGVPRDIVVANCIAEDMTAPAFDTHPEAESIKYIGCHAYGGKTSTGADDGMGFQVRGKEVTIEGCSSIASAGVGIYVSSVGGGGGPAYIRGCLIQDVKAGTNAGHGVKIDGTAVVSDLIVNGADGAAVDITTANNRVINVVSSNTGRVSNVAAINIAASATGNDVMFCTLSSPGLSNVGVNIGASALARVAGIQVGSGITAINGTPSSTDIFNSGLRHRHVTNSASNIAYDSLLAGEANARFRFFSSGQWEWGPGSAATDTNLYRAAANQLKTDDTFVGADGVATKTKAGIPADGDFATAPPDGTLAVDTTNNKIYVRIGGAWKSVGVA